MAYLGSAALSTLYGRLYITKGSTFHTNLAVFLLHLPLVKFSRFANLEPYHSHRTRWGTPCLPLPTLSGKYSLPSAASAGPVRPVAGWFGCLGSIGALASDDLKVRGRRFTRQPPNQSALLMVWHGAQATHPVMEPRPRPPAQIPWARPLCQANLKSCNVPH